MGFLWMADDVAYFNTNAQAASTQIQELQTTGAKMGLRINQQKTKVLKTQACTEEGVTLDGELLEEQEDFVYLGSKTTNTNAPSTAISHRISQAAKTFGEMWKTWRDKTLRTSVKIQIYKTIIRAILLYGLDTIPLSNAHAENLDARDRSFLRKILGKNFYHPISNQDLYKATGLTPLSTILQYRRRQWYGHVQRMEEHRLPKRITQPDMEGLRRGRGRPRQRLRDTWKRDFAQMGMTLQQAQEAAQDKKAYRNLIKPYP